MKYIIGNWKMNPNTESEAISLVEKVSGEVGKSFSEDVYVGMAVPFPFLGTVKKLSSEINIGAQNIFWEKSGAFTGEVSFSQIKSVGAKFVILGHSERRIHMKESNEMIKKKLEMALEGGLDVFLCVGEPAEVREKGVDPAKEYVKKQLEECLPNPKKINNRLIIAYEPVWAISTFEGARPAEPEDAQEMISFIKNMILENFSLDIPVIYGGSTNAKNVKSFVSQPDIDGCLPGGASLKPDEFSEMVKIIKNL